MNPYLFVILCMAAHRLALLGSKELGPYGIFAKLRRAAKKAPAKTKLAQGSECLWCWSVWIAIVLVSLAVLSHLSGLFIAGVTILAVSDGAIILNQLFTKGK